MGKFIDLTNMKFERLTVLHRDKNHNRFVHWICKCDCGKIISVRSQHLLSGATKSCGCYGIERIKQSNTIRNKIDILGNMALLHLSNSDKLVLIDREDVDRIKDCCWAISHYGYATTHIDDDKRLFLHRKIMDVYDKRVVDHINHNKLDNRKCNLRIFENNTPNLHNMKPNPNSLIGIRNISYSKKKNKFIVSYKRFGKKYFVGNYNTLDEAKDSLLQSIKEHNFIYGGF